MIKETGRIQTIVVSEDKELASICDCCGKTVSVYPESEEKEHLYDLGWVAIRTYDSETIMHVCENCFELLKSSSCIDVMKNGVNYETVKKQYENWKEHGFAKWCSWAWKKYVMLPFWVIMGVCGGAACGIFLYQLFEK